MRGGELKESALTICPDRLILLQAEIFSSGITSTDTQPTETHSTLTALSLCLSV